MLVRTAHRTLSARTHWLSTIYTTHKVFHTAKMTGTATIPTKHIPWTKLPATYTTTGSTPITYAVRHPTPADSAALNHLAFTTFNDTFAKHPLNKSEDVEAYNTSAFSPALQLAEINSPNITIFLCERTDTHELIGYVQLKHNSYEPCCKGAQPTIEIQRLYMDKVYHGNGIAQQLYKLTIEYTTTVLQCRSLWLGVWQVNHKATRFYEKCGFKRVGEHVFMFGSDPQTDNIMEMNLPSTA